MSKTWLEPICEVSEVHVNISIEGFRKKKHRVLFSKSTPMLSGLQPAPVASLIKVQQTKAVALHAWLHPEPGSG